KAWKEADAVFTRDPDGKWEFRTSLEAWEVEVSGIRFKLEPTDFGHLGIFPEQKPQWEWIRNKVKTRPGASVLNLFAYSGGSTLAAAQGGAEVCHLDASKKMCAWAKENARINGLEEKPIRWIVDDVRKFLMREERRGRRYDAVILDPPSFGRGPKGELFKIEEHLPDILNHIRAVLSDDPLFILFSCHSPGFTPLSCGHLIAQMMHGFQGVLETGEMVLEGENVFSIPSGAYARWSAC
ncbi:MAG: class I SAM-dependent methyltransferase, partial [Chlamydiia bacterium]|nr:class I SAM-dependent methyltransferase [Chlamydiia bacterium]